MWPKNSTLNVVFIDGTTEQKAVVKRYAPLWTENSSLQLAFFDSLAHAPKYSHIRISFQSHTGSILGNHGDLVDQAPTLQLAELNRLSLESERAKRLILHEFGHALGFEHEFRNPLWPYQYSPIEKQISECTPRLQAIGFNAQDATIRCREINQMLEPELINATIFDEFSIMNYPLTIPINRQQNKTIKATSQLSILDKLAMERWYGKKTQ
ncbi:hypothetical protein [Aliikangiella maris]|uniref:Peptidase metallopeptidase domain-containing protein n=2 Tax=Aliikangiella maris TaxID=3162458 RepID=A0ABV2BW65_9GAMM